MEPSQDDRDEAIRCLSALDHDDATLAIYRERSEINVTIALATARQQGRQEAAVELAEMRRACVNWTLRADEKEMEVRPLRDQLAAIREAAKPLAAFIADGHLDRGYPVFGEDLRKLLAAIGETP